MRFITALLIALCFQSATALADDARKVNFMIFMKQQATYEYDPIMFGGFSQFIKQMSGTRLLLLSHNAKAINGDVINLQQDVLHERKDSGFDDVGVNCQLSLRDHDALGDPAWQISGDCQIIGKYHNKSIALKAHIPATDLPDTAKGTDVWIDVYEDSESGIAFYANVSKDARAKHTMP